MKAQDVRGGSNVLICVKLSKRQRDMQLSGTRGANLKRWSGGTVFRRTDLLRRVAHVNEVWRVNDGNNLAGLWRPLENRVPAPSLPESKKHEAAVQVAHDEQTTHQRPPQTASVPRWSTP